MTGPSIRQVPRESGSPAAPKGDGKRLLVAVLLTAGIVLDLALLGYGLDVVRPLVQGGDYILLRNVAADWLAGGSFYPAWQLVPYEYADAMVLYPPWALALFLPFTVLPDFLWWLIPAAIVGGTTWYWRPRPAALVAIGICSASYPMIVTVNQGNPTMWVAAFLALGTRWPAYAALVLLKPSLFPFALLGIRHRGWWVVVTIFAAVALVMLPMTMDWLHVMANMRGGRGLLYSLPDVVVLAVPLIAWAGRGEVRHATSPDVGSGREADGSAARRIGGVYRAMDRVGVVSRAVSNGTEVSDGERPYRHPATAIPPKP